MTRARALRLVLVEDHQLMREGLRSLLEFETDLRIVGEAGSVEELQQLSCDADVVVSDLFLPDAQSADVIVAVRAQFPDARILVLSMVDRPVEIQEAFAAGALGYVVKEAAVAELVTAIRTVAKGETYLQSSLVSVLTGQKRESAQTYPDAPRTSLTPRESSVARLVALGHTNSEIAAIMTLSERTVESHRARLMSKLGMRTRAELVRFALANLMDPPSS